MTVPSAADMLNAYHALALQALKPAEKTRAYDAVAALLPLCRVVDKPAPDPAPQAVAHI